MAWTRTSLSMISIGVTLMKLFGKEEETLGFVFLLLGVLFGGVSSLRFYKTFEMLDSGRFKTNSLTIMATTILSLLANVTLILLLVYKATDE